MNGFVGYIRCSTKRQSASGLGLDAQTLMIEQYVESQGNSKVVKVFTEVESGGNNDRSILNECLAFAKSRNLTLVVARLDRLSRSVKLIAGLLDSGINFVIADNPNANKLTIGLLSCVAQYEREIVSLRIKEALFQAKQRGVKLGGYKGYIQTPENLKAARDTYSLMCKEKSAELITVVETIKEERGLTSANAIAKELTTLGIPTINGKSTWYAAQVINLYKHH